MTADAVSTTTLTAEAARALIDSARADLGAGFTKVTAAYLGRAWEALEYSTWADLCAAEFTDVASLALPPGARRDEVVAELRAAGLSLRDIAAATSLSKSTVARALTVPDGTPLPLPAGPVDPWDQYRSDPLGWQRVLSDYPVEVAAGRPRRIDIPATIEAAVERLERLAVVECATMAAVCAAHVDLDRPHPEEPDYLDELLEHAEGLRGWPVVGEYLALLGRHGHNVRAGYAQWARGRAEYCESPEEFADLAAVGAWVKGALS